MWGRTLISDYDFICYIISGGYIDSANYILIILITNQGDPIYANRDQKEKALENLKKAESPAAKIPTGEPWSGDH